MTTVNDPLSSCTERKTQSFFKVIPKDKLVPRKKVLVTVWWSVVRLIHYSFLSPGENITSEKYAQQTGEMC